MKILLDGDGKPPGGGGDDKPKDPTAPGLPTTPGDVKKTPLKHPQIIALEKKVSELEDKTDTLSEALDGVNSVLEGLKIGGPTPGPKKIPVTDPTAPATPKGFLNELDDFIWGKTP